MIKSEAALILQLWRAISEMEHIDELFRWLLQTVVRSVGVQIGQIWTYQTEDSNSPSLELREFFHRDLSLPWDILTGEPTAAVAEHIMRKQRNIPLQTVHASYSTHAATLLQRYGVKYCAGYGVQDGLYLPAKGGSQVVSVESVPQKLVLLILSRHAPRESIKEIPLLLQQTLIMAERCHLLQIQQPEADVKPLDSSLAVDTLVPRHTTDAASNPLALPLTIGDKKARMLYSAIDDRKTVAELAGTIHLSTTEIAEALQLLLEQGRIQLYEPWNSSTRSRYHFFNKERGKA